MPYSDKEKIKFRSAKKMRDIMGAYYIDAMNAKKNNKFVAWITSGGPVEPLVAMDIIPIYPENYGAMIGSAKMGEYLCAKAEDMGYSSALCSYARADISSAIVKGGPIGGLPEPDMLVCCNNICGTVLKWWEVQARYFNVPLFILDTPVIHTEYNPEVARYVSTQIKEYVAFLESVTKKKFDYDRMAEVGRLSKEGQLLWEKVLNSATNKPSPMSAFDAFFFLALIVTLRGTQTAVDFYKELIQELDERITGGIGVVPDEKYRLLWDNLPIWYQLKWLYSKFSEQNACLVADSYTTAWCSGTKYFDEKNFLDSMGEAYTHIYLNLGVDKMADHILKMIKFYDVDGFVMHSNRSCKPYSFGQLDIMRTVQEKADIPVLMIEADMTDPRNFSQSQVETRIDAFMEIIKQRST